MTIRDRIIELVKVPANTIELNPKNWRTHSRRQSEVLRGMVEEVGYAVPAICYRTAEGKLRLIDGAMRREEFNDQIISAVVLDVTEAEADKLLATLDPMSTLAGVDPGNLRSLMDQINVQSSPVIDMLDQLAAENGLMDGQGGLTEEADEVLLDQAVQLKPQQEYCVIACASEEEWERLKVALGLKQVMRGGWKPGSEFGAASGTQRVVPASHLFTLLKEVS